MYTESVDTNSILVVYTSHILNMIYYNKEDGMTVIQKKMKLIFTDIMQERVN
jgi:hypothetical protein